MRSRAFFRWIWLSSVLAVTQARANLHHTHAGFQSCPTTTVTITQSATTATVTQTVPTTVNVSIHPSTTDRAIFSSKVAAASNSSTAVSTIAPIAPVYGSVVDYNDTKPIYNQQPGTLPNRTEGSINVTGIYTLPWPGSLGGSNLLFAHGQYLNLTGTGYFMIRWEIGFFNNRCGWMVPPFWSGLEGKLFHVASGGGRRMDDAVNYAIPDEAPHSAKTWMGDLSPDCLISLPEGYQQMWNNEYYYIDGSATLYENEGWADYNLGYTARTWQDIFDDINTPPNGGAIKRYGLVRDTGDDDCPVPQYLTRTSTFNGTLIQQEPSV